MQTYISIMQISIHIQIIMQIPINQVKRLLPYHSPNYQKRRDIGTPSNWCFFERDINADMNYKTVHYHSIASVYISFCANIFLYGVTLSNKILNNIQFFKAQAQLFASHVKWHLYLRRNALTKLYYVRWILYKSHYFNI